MNKKIILMGVMTGVFLSSFAHLNPNRQQQSQNSASYKTEAGDCHQPASQYTMEINNVRCRVLNAGDLWWDLNAARYEVPKGNGSSAPVYAIFEGAVWFSGKDAGNNLKLAALTYRQGTTDFYAGPLNSTGVSTSAVCNVWDKHFNVYGADIAALQAAAPENRAAAITDDIRFWPGKGNPNLEARGYDMSSNLAPFWDADLDGIYNPEQGDYPTIKDSSEAYADQMVFWVFNDNGGPHTASLGQPIKLQSNTLAFAFQTTDEVNNMTFYTYNIINKSGIAYNQFYMSQYVDPDLGCYSDDYVGCDTSRSLAYVYNANAVDQVTGCGNGVVGYGTNLPMLGFDFFEGPIDTNGVQKGLSSFVYYTGIGATSAGQSDPTSYAQFRNYQEGRWADGSCFTFGGTGYGGSGNCVKYLFPGNPADAGGWSECNTQGGTSPSAQGDRRLVLTSGPFTFLPNATQHITVGVIFVQPQGGVGQCPDVNAVLGQADDKAQALFNSGFKLLDGPDAPSVTIRELDRKLILNWTNLPSSNNFGESYRVADATIYTATGFVDSLHMDSFYTFQGYKVYQLVNDQVSATDFNDATKAQLIAQYDIKDDITRLINYDKDPITQLYIPSVKVDGKNQGIEHSLVVTTDAFTGKEIINHKSYYFAVIAYASNNFKQYNPSAPLEGGQLTQYLQGRKFARYQAIPHPIDSRNGGTLLQSQYGDGVEVLRIQGQANGGNLISVTKSTLEKIVADGFADTLRYEKSADPLGFTVTDPVALKEADFELQIKDTAFNGRVLSPSATWTLRELDSNGNVIDSIDSEVSLSKPYKQQIARMDGSNRIDYGFSLSLGTPVAVDSNMVSRQLIYNSISGNINYAEPSKKWLSFVVDEGVNTATNWIRSGYLRVSGRANQDPLAGVFDANYYQVGSNAATAGSPFIDDSSRFDKIAGGTWAPYCLAASYHLANPSACGAQPATPVAVHAPGFRYDKWQACPFATNAVTQAVYPTMPSARNTLDRLQSVDIVITPDKTKWSQCIVFETGEELATVKGGTRKGLLRAAPSKDIDGNPFTNPVTGDVDSGRSWFPGYAVNVETGQRLNIAFGESSEWPEQNGADMFWNPTDKKFSDAPNYNFGDDVYTPFFGGKHFIYVMETPYDGGLDMRDSLAKAATRLPASPSGSYPGTIDSLYKKIMYTSIPYLTKGYSFNTSGGVPVPPSEVHVQIRVERPFATLLTNEGFGNADSMPLYRFSTRGMGAKENVQEVAKDALDDIRIVPNPYIAYSSYETSAADTRVRITNLPNNCTVQIYTLDGTLVRTLRRAVNTSVPDPVTGVVTDISSGINIDKTNTILESSMDWDLKNEANVPVASGIYLFDITAPGIGHKVLKWFGAMRPTDVSNF